MQFKKQFETGKFACLVQIEPPKGTDVSSMVANALSVKGEVNAFIVPEMGNAVMRMSSLGAAIVLHKQGLDAVVQVNCRDRNRLALQGDILAAGALGINSLMIETGDDPSFGDHHETKAVYDIVLDELLKVLDKLEHGKDMAGVELSGTPQFLKGTTLNTCLRGADREKELDRMKKMIDLDVKFFVTQPLFEFEMTQSFVKIAEKNDVKVIPTVLLLKSLGMARYMARNMDSLILPEPIVERIQKAGDKVRECSKVAKEMIKEVKANNFGGVNVSCMGWEHKLPELLGVMEGLKG
ncbi:MAG: methylenetetrahydrofolate reductase [Desulfobacteraceae bacterium]|nr:methylenetetrahydrofolate reductase [Desulfobacteraceae bacterium]